MKKIGIITDAASLTCDRILRSTALCRAITTLGFEPVTADYTSLSYKLPCTSRNMAHYAFERICQHVKKGFTTPAPQLCSNRIRLERYQAFRSRFGNLSQPIRSASELFALSERSDAFITACDPICSCSHYDPHLFLDFVTEREKRIAYAIGSGKGQFISDPFSKNISHALKDFHYVSCQADAHTELKRLVGHDIPIVDDPVLLLSSDQYTEMENATNMPQQPYLLSYFTAPSSPGWKHAAEIARALNYINVAIPVYDTDLVHGNTTRSDAGPAELIALIHNANRICTDSPAAVILSILFRTPFTAVVNSSSAANLDGQRMEYLLKQTGLYAQCRSDRPGIYCCDCIDLLDAARKKLDAMRKSNLLHLHETLTSACSSPRSSGFKVTNTCCGCGACERICPRGAIKVSQDANGFRIALIDNHKCIRCGKCRKVCPFFERHEKSLFDMHALYAFKADSETLAHSASGGFSYALGEHLAQNGYSMLGCVYDKDLRKALHRLAAPVDTTLRENFQGSKYIQSDLSAVFDAIDHNFKHALFIGTPCQVSAVARLLGDRRKDWILCELICHGLSSDNLWEKYLNHLDNTEHTGHNPAVLFHPKKFDWKPSHHISVEGNGCHYDRISYEDPFYQAFFSHLALRDSCFDCPYRRMTCADLRIGDYWGKRYSKDKTGVSMVVVCSERGQEVLDQVAARAAMCIPYPKSDYCERQLVANLPVPAERKAFLNALNDPDVSMAQLHKKWLAPRYLGKKWKNCYVKLRKALLRH